MYSNASSNTKEEFARSVCLFLAEMLRTRKVNLRRAAEIAEGVVRNIEQVDDEQGFLKLTQKLEYEFQELGHLRQDLLFYYKVNQRERLESLVREFVSREVIREPQQAIELMQEALRPEQSLNALEAKFPRFKEFVNQQKEG